MRWEVFDFVKLTLPACTSDADAPFAYLTEGERYPRQQVDRFANEGHIAGEGIIWCKVCFIN